MFSQKGQKKKNKKKRKLKDYVSYCQTRRYKTGTVQQPEKLL